MLSRCNPYLPFLPKSPIPAEPRDDGIDSPPFWPLPPGPACVECADTGPSPIGPKASAKRPGERFGCRYANGRYIVPSEYIIRDVLIRVDPVHLDRALQRWNETYAQEDESLAIDGKTMCNAIDDQGHQTHILSVVGHQSKNCYTQKKSVPCP